MDQLERKLTEALTAPHTIEIIFGRGISIYLDGKEPDKEFHIEGEFGPKWTTVGLSFNGVPITSIEFDTDPDDMFITSFTATKKGDDRGVIEPTGREINIGSMEEPKPPTTVKLKMGDTEIAGKAVKTLINKRRVRLLNGEIVDTEGNYYIQFRT